MAKTPNVSRKRALLSSAGDYVLSSLQLGAKNLFGRIIEARRKLHESDPDAPIETVYVCDDYPRADDRISGPGSHVSSAAFLRAHEAHRLSWRLQEWCHSEYGTFVASVQEHSGLSDAEFEVAWRSMRFITGGQRRTFGIHTAAGDIRRLDEIAALLPKLVADSADRDRWPVSELLARLHWEDPFGLRHAHSFPVDALYQSNAPTQEELSKALTAITSGYLSLVGPPGSGKSTLLAAGLLSTARAYIVRYLAFVPGQGQGLGRGEAFDFLHDLTKQLKQQNLGTNIVPSSELAELRKQFQSLLAEAGERFRRHGTRTVIVVDGLDHVPREEKPQRSFLCELPTPQAVPDGVVFVLGTQQLNLTDIPPAVADQARQTGRCIPIAPLSREAVNRLAELAGVPADVDRGRLYSRTEGHPLSTRYMIDGLLRAETLEDRENWLVNGPAYGGDVNVFYQRAWHDLEGNTQAQRGMAYVALAEGPIRPVSLDPVIGPEATDAVWRAAGHLLLRNSEGAWSIFHNSFRLFLREKTAWRHGLPDEQGVRRRYQELAAMARVTECDDVQQWMELRYRARAGEDHAVAALATPERFRSQFVDGRNPAELRADLSFSFHAAKVLHRPELVLDLILISHELSMRTEAFGDEVFSAFIDVGDFRAARGLLEAEGVTLTAGKGFELVDAYLSQGEVAEARKLFEALEPIDKLLGSEPIQRPDEDGLEEWAEHALAFREPDQVLTSIERLRGPDDPFYRDFDVDGYQTSLKLLAARGQLFHHPELSLEPLMQSLKISETHRGVILCLAARAAYQANENELALQQLQATLPHADQMPDELRRQSSKIAATLGRLDLCRSFLEGVPAPTIEEQEFIYREEDLRSASRQVILHASLVSRTGLPFVGGKRPASQLLATYQIKLERLGRLLGDGFAKRQPHVAALQEFEATLDFLQRAEGEGTYDAKRWHLTTAMPEAVAAMIEASYLLGRETFLQLTEMMDTRLADHAGRLGLPPVRRAYATAAFHYDRDPIRAEKRLAYEPGIENTPAEQLREAALTASTLIRLGRKDRAQRMLVDMRREGVGYSRPAKKDPQYLLWRDLLIRANKDDPAGRPHRLCCFGRLLRGMVETEGRSAASRLTETLLEEAAQAGPGWAMSAADLVEECSLSTWSDIVSALLMGLVRGKPQWTEVVGLVLGRVALPFASEVDLDPLTQLVRMAPADQMERVVRRMTDYLETDAPHKNRILALEAVVNAAVERGIEYGSEALQRWRDELPPPQSGNSPEDPFFLVRSLEGIAAVLAKTQSSTESYGAVPAFVRIAPQSDYDSTKALFDGEPVLNQDERSIETMARLALANGRRHDAEELISQIKRLAEERGSWAGGFQSKAKQRYYQLLVALGSEAARRAAFDAFVDDLANRREYLVALLSELGPLLELTAPTLTWTDAWARLEAHLSQFREHQRSRDLEEYQGVAQGEEHLLADLLFRAMETTSAPLTEMARTAAVEMTGVPGGVTVLSALVPRLWSQGGYSALEAAQILWECRSAKTIRGVAEFLLPAMRNSPDMAVRQIAMKISQEWNWPVAPQTGELPPAYTITLPPNPTLESFDPPSGMSATSAGLYTEHPSTWTWALEIPLRMVSDFTGLKLINLRMRVFQFMSQAGGTAVFGPDAVKHQLAKLDRLELYTSFRKLLNAAAFQAMREVVGELHRAKAISTKDVARVLMFSGAFSPVIRTTPPATRPKGVPAPVLPDAFGLLGDNEWMAGVQEDATRPSVEGFTVLAATAFHERRTRDQRWEIEQYFGPDTGSSADSLFGQLQQLPHVFLTDRVMVLSPHPSAGGVVHPQPDFAGSVDLNTLMLCPMVAAEVGWRADPNHVFTYTDANGDVVAYTLCWRDGGVPSRQYESTVHRYGYTLLVREDQTWFLKSHLAENYLVRAWRRIRKNVDDQGLSASASRTEKLSL